MKTQNNSELIKEYVLDKNLTLYRNEIWSISSAILQLKDRLLSTNTYLKRASIGNNHLFDSSPDPHEIIASILNNSSRLHKLFEVSSRRKNETKDQYVFRKERAEIIKKKFLPYSTEPLEIFKSSARNSIEHFDERIDHIMNCLIEQNINVEQTLIAYNLSVSSLDYFKPKELLLPIKVWDMGEMDYYMVGKELKKECVNLNRIFEEVEGIEEKVVKYVDQNSPKDSVERKGPTGVYIPINKINSNSKK